jgi:hypothetical protein
MTHFKPYPRQSEFYLTDEEILYPGGQPAGMSGGQIFRMENMMTDEHFDATFLALVKLYDGYITPFDCHVRCWKMRGGNEFLLGITVTKPSFTVGADAEQFHIVYRMPLKYWHVAKVMEVNEIPKHNSEENIENLFKL